MEETNNFKKNGVSFSDLIKIISTSIAIIGAVTFFIYKMQSLPPRVEKLEQDLSNTRKELTYEMNNLKSQMDRNSAKTDVILDDVKIIKTHILNKKD